jgi:hypothetical protein
MIGHLVTNIAQFPAEHYLAIQHTQTHMCVGALHEDYLGKTSTDGRITFNTILVNMLRGCGIIVQKGLDQLAGFVVPSTEHRIQRNKLISFPILGDDKLLWLAALSMFRTTWPS